MHLSAVAVPPPQVLDEVRDRLRTVTEPRVVAPRPAGWRRERTGRRGGRRTPEAVVAPSPTSSGPAFLAAPDAEMLVAKFGHVSITDAERLTDRLTEELAGLPAPLLRLEGADREAWAETRSLHAVLGGDLETLREAIRAVQAVAARMQLFVDRRVFRPFVRVGAVSEHASQAHAAALVDSLADFVGEWWWQDSLSLVTPASRSATGTELRTHADLPLLRRRDLA